DASRTPALHELLHFLTTEPAEVARDRVLETRRCYRELQRLSMACHVQQPVDQSAREAIAPADAIHDVRDVVITAEQKIFPIVEARRPTIVRRALRFAQRDR